MSSMFVFHLAFAAAEEAPRHCALFEVRMDCDLSGWMKLFMGDIGIGAFLAVLLHTFSHRNQKKIEEIIDSEKKLKERRHSYSVIHLKNLLNLILFTMSIIKRSINQYNSSLTITDTTKQIWIQSNTLSKLRADEAKLGRLLLSIRNLMVASNDVLAPEIVSSVEGVCNFIGEITVEESPDNSMQFPKYTVCRLKVVYLLETLQGKFSSSSQKKIIKKSKKQVKDISSSVIVEGVKN